jgi:hypothetical protein
MNLYGIGEFSKELFFFAKNESGPPACHRHPSTRPKEKIIERADKNSGLNLEKLI